MWNIPYINYMNWHVKQSLNGLDEFYKSLKDMSVKLHASTIIIYVILEKQKSRYIFWSKEV
jgi:hypothetical protein